MNNTMYLSYSFLLSNMLNDTTNKFTDDHLKYSLFYFGCHSSIAFDWNVFCEDYKWLALNKVKPVWERLQSFLLLDNALFRKDLDERNHINCLNSMLVNHGFNAVQGPINEMSLQSIKKTLTDTNPQLNVVW